MRIQRVTSFVVAALTLSITACASGGGGQGPLREPVGTGSPLFSDAVRTGNLIYTSGVIGRSADGDIQAATRQAMSGVQSRIEAAGGSMADVVKCTVLMIDIADYNGMNQVYPEYFPGTPPARTAVAVLALPANAQVEVECIAAVR